MARSKASSQSSQAFHSPEHLSIRARQASPPGTALWRGRRKEFNHSLTQRQVGKRWRARLWRRYGRADCEDVWGNYRTTMISSQSSGSCIRSCPPLFQNRDAGTGTRRQRRSSKTPSIISFLACLGWSRACRCFRKSSKNAAAGPLVDCSRILILGGLIKSRESLAQEVGGQLPTAFAPVTAEELETLAASAAQSTAPPGGCFGYVNSLVAIPEVCALHVQRATSHGKVGVLGG